jgi:hypothetical protein
VFNGPKLFWTRFASWWGYWAIAICIAISVILLYVGPFPEGVGQVLFRVTIVVGLIAAFRHERRAQQMTPIEQRRRMLSYVKLYIIGLVVILFAAVIFAIIKGQ